jgi:hypothetical protein
VILEQLANSVNVEPSLYRITTLYPVITDPPSAGAAQVTKTLVPEIVVVGFTGVWGIVGSTAPFPEVDAAEAPKTFMAYTLA